ASSYRRAQSPDEPARRQFPDSRRLIFGGGDEVLIGSVHTDALDLCRVHPRLDAQDWLLGNCRPGQSSGDQDKEYSQCKSKGRIVKVSFTAEEQRTQRKCREKRKPLRCLCVLCSSAANPLLTPDPPTLPILISRRTAGVMILLIWLFRIQRFPVEKVCCA